MLGECRTGQIDPSIHTLLDTYLVLFSYLFFLNQKCVLFFPQMQVGFIDVICLPLYKVMSDTFPWIQPLYDGTYENRKHWQDLAEKVRE